MRGYEEEKYYHDERGAKGDSAKATDCAVSIAGAVWGDDDGLDKGSLLVGWHGGGCDSPKQSRNIKLPKLNRDRERVADTSVCMSIL